MCVLCVRYLFLHLHVFLLRCECFFIFNKLLLPMTEHMFVYLWNKYWFSMTTLKTSTALTELTYANQSTNFQWTYVCHNAHGSIYLNLTKYFGRYIGVKVLDERSTLYVSVLCTLRIGIWIWHTCDIYRESEARVFILVPSSYYNIHNVIDIRYVYCV